MEDFSNPLGFLNSTLFLWIAGIIAAVFVLVILFDVIYRRRADRKKRRHSTSGAPRRPGFFKNISLLQRQWKQEMTRRRRHRERARDREDVRH